jgi:hypothetical protein
MWIERLGVVIKTPVSYCGSLEFDSQIKGRILFRAFMGFFCRTRDSVVGIATGYGLDDRRVGVRVPVGSRIFSSARRPNIVSNGYRGYIYEFCFPVKHKNIPIDSLTFHCA